MKIKKIAKDFWNDESGQGMLEYILIAVAVVAAAVAMRPWLTGLIEGQQAKLEGELDGGGF